MAEQQELKTYRGNCHCTAYVYEITLPEIKTAFECNCSICYKRAAIWVFPTPANVNFVKGDPDTLNAYTFNSGTFTHKSCSTCGTSVMVVGHKTPAKPGKLPENGFNVRALQHGQVDIQQLDIKKYDGRALPPHYENPKFTGSEPTGELEGGQLYHGSCHCGAITVCLKTKPLNKETQGLIECNCSICGKYGATWVYPNKTQVVISGRENLGVYLFGKHIAKKLFCKTCCVPIGSEINPHTDEELAQLDELTRQWYGRSKDNVSINLRIIDDLNVYDLTPMRMDGYHIIKPLYAEP